MRWLGAIALALLVSLPQAADAQAFKPRGGTKTEKKAAPKKAAPKKAAKKSPKKKKKSRAATASRAEDLTPEPEAKKSPEDEDDYVLIVDDES